MIVTKFNYDKNADEVKKWGAKYAFPLPPALMLPDTGFIIEGLVCGFLYCSNSSLGWLEWVFANPERSQEDRAQGLDILFRVIEKTAKELGIKALFSASGLASYSKVLERNGFSETDKNVTHYIKLVGGA